MENGNLFTQILKKCCNNLPITENDAEILKELIENISLQYKDGESNSYLHTVVKSPTVFSILFEYYKHKINTLINHKGENLLIYALRSKQFKCVIPFIIDNIRDKNHQDNLGNTALHYASLFYYKNPKLDTLKEIIQSLIESASNPYITNNVGKTPFDYYISNKDVYNMISPHNNVIILEHYLQEKKYLEAYKFFTEQSDFWQSHVNLKEKVQQSKDYQQMLTEALHETFAQLNYYNADLVTSNIKDLISMGANVSTSGNNDHFNFIYLLTAIDNNLFNIEVKKDIISFIIENQKDNLLEALSSEMCFPSQFIEENEKTLYTFIKEIDSELFDYTQNIVEENAVLSIEY